MIGSPSIDVVLISRRPGQDGAGACQLPADPHQLPRHPVGDPTDQQVPCVGRGAEDPGCDVAVDDVVPVGQPGQADAAQRGPEVVGPEAGDTAERRCTGPGEQVPRRRDALLGRVAPVLDAHPQAAERGVGPAGDVACRVDALQSDQTEALVAGHAVGDVGARPGQPADVGHGSHRDDDVVGHDLRPVGQHHAVAAPRALDVPDGVAHVQIDAGRQQQRGGGLAGQRAGRRHGRIDADHGDLGAECHGGRGGLDADEAAPDDQQPHAGDQSGPQAQGVVQRPDRVDRRPRGVERRERASGTAGGQDQPVVGHLLAVGERHDGAPGVQCGGGDAELPLRRQLRSHRQAHVLLGQLAEQHLLGQRRSVVGQPRLVADQRQPALVALTAQGLAGTQAGQAGPDDDDPTGAAHRPTIRDRAALGSPRRVCTTLCSRKDSSSSRDSSRPRLLFRIPPNGVPK
jgi:hypothetical protein